MKTCTRCDETKWLDEYHRNRRSLDGKQSWCKVCTVTYMREKRANECKLGKRVAA